MNLAAILTIIEEPAAIYSIIFLIALCESLVVVGLFFPGTTFMLLVGYLCSIGKISFITATAIILVASQIGGVSSFYIGAYGHRHLPFFRNPKSRLKLYHAEKFFQKYGTFGVLLHRFIGPLRPFIPALAGFLKMKPTTFIVFDLLSNLGSVVFYVFIGTFSANYWSKLL